MAIYIAVCNDNIADRKQLERLLGREALKRGREGTPVYIDSFGSSEALLKTPNRYDLFLIDITQEGDAACLQTASHIKRNGIDSLIVIISSTIDHRADFSDSDMHFLFRDQPLLQSDISELVDLAMEKAADRTPVIEVRCQNETRFLKPEEFLYAQAKDKISQIEINLFDGSSIMSTETIDQFSSNLASFNNIVRIGLYYVNLSHISGLSSRTVFFNNGTKLPLSLKDFLLLRKLCR